MVWSLRNILITVIFFSCVSTMVVAEKNKPEKVSALTRYLIELYDDGELLNTYQAQRIIKETSGNNGKVESGEEKELSQQEYFVKHRGHRDPFAEEEEEYNTVSTHPCVTFEVRERARLIPITVCGTYSIKKLR